jgi:ribonuclease HII
MKLRRSPRPVTNIAAISSDSSENNPFIKNSEVRKASRKKVTKRSEGPLAPSRKAANSTRNTLARTREKQLIASGEVDFVLGIDEAGRGPLAGPVVAAAVSLPCTTLVGIADSKKITSEEARFRLYQELLSCPDIRYAVAVVDAATIDEINILQATMTAMSMAASGVLGNDGIRYKDEARASHDGSYVVCAGKKARNCKNVYALIDGNRVPSDLPCLGESIVKGDGKEYLIGAASILAKVTRDLLMKEYNELYPEYLLEQHKGYPTARHMELVRTFGPSPIHRRTFAPIKFMDLEPREDAERKANP